MNGESNAATPRIQSALSVQVNVAKLCFSSSRLVRARRALRKEHGYVRKDRGRREAILAGAELCNLICCSRIGSCSVLGVDILPQPQARA